MLASPRQIIDHSDEPGLRKAPKGFSLGVSERDLKQRAERVMLSELGQEALRDGWGRMLWEHVFEWGSAPKRAETIWLLRRSAEEFERQCEGLEEIEGLEEVTAALRRLGESRLRFEAELRAKYKRK